ncbi:type II secretion system F family protein [Pseudonocardia sp.]|uniref:type II secretion system F family protein n=1 Tax=Pseudonocardia sp. TaxID=60912 RepID=UPI002613C072|nr:type II secretion system F family protein [Pseudonocardia sp.]
MSPQSGASLALVLLAGAVLLGRQRVGSRRLRARTAPPTSTPPVRTVWTAVGVAAAGALGWALAGAPAAVAGSALALATLLAGRRLLPRPPRDRVDLAALAAGWDLLAICLRAGLPVAVAVSAAAAPLRDAAGTELRRVAGLLDLGADPADAWRGAQDTAALAVFARAAGRSAATGAALAQVAGAEAGRLRAELVDTAQARAQRAGVLIAGPLGLCFLPAFLVLGIAPVVIGLAGEALGRW